MSTYAIIKTGGKQVKVEVGQAIYVEKLDVEAGQDVTFDEVVLVGVKTLLSELRLFLELLLLELLKNRKTKKVVTYKYKPKKVDHRKQGTTGQP